MTTKKPLHELIHVPMTNFNQPQESETAENLRLILKIMKENRQVPAGAEVTEWKTVPHRAVWKDNGIKCLMPTTAMADAFWRVFSKRCKYLDGSSGYYESFGAAYEAMLDAWQKSDE